MSCVLILLRGTNCRRNEMYTEQYRHIAELSYSLSFPMPQIVNVRT
jgi:hypothetical protein